MLGIDAINSSVPFGVNIGTKPAVRANGRAPFGLVTGGRVSALRRPAPR